MHADHTAGALEFRCAIELTPEALTTATNHCFTGYFVPVQFDVKTLAYMQRVDSVDLTTSCVALRSGEIVGVAFAARRGWNGRLAAMAIAPNARSQGVGRALTEAVVRAAGERGDRQFTLEVIQANFAAVHLYTACGFKKLRQLAGYSAASVPGQKSDDLIEINPEDAAAAVEQWGLADLPWQLAAPTVAALAPPYRAFRLGPAYAVIGDPASDTIVVRSLVVSPTERRRGWGTKILQAISARYPGKKWRIPIWVPEEIPAAFFSKLGFSPEQLTQFHMARPL